MRIEADIDQVGATDTTTISDGDISTSTGDLDLSPGSGNVDINGSVDVIGAGSTITIDNGTITDSANDLTIDSDNVNFVGATNDVSVVDGDVLWQTNGQDALIRAATGAGVNDMTVQGGTGSASAGGNTYIKGGAAAGTDKNGGNLYLYSGTATGNGYSSILLAPVDGNYGSGTTTRNPTTYITCDGNLQRITMARNTTFSGTVTINSNTDITGTFDVTGDVGITGDLSISGYVNAGSYVNGISSSTFGVKGTSSAVGYAGVHGRAANAGAYGLYGENTGDGYGAYVTTSGGSNPATITINNSTGEAFAAVNNGGGLAIVAQSDGETANFISSTSTCMRVTSESSNLDAIVATAEGTGVGVNGYSANGYGVIASSDTTSNPPLSASFRIVPQAGTPSGLLNGAMWIVGANLYVRLNGVTKTVTVS